MSSGNDTITGTSGADIIDAGEGDDIVNTLAGNDTITGGKGDDILNGGTGNDTYNYARGDGNDTITELSLGGSSDRLVFTGINQADVTLVRNGADVTLVIAESAPSAGDGGSILLKDNFEDVTDRGIDRIVFADNSAWTRASLRAAWLAQVSTSGNDTITGFNAADTITGGAGNDVIDGGKGNDIYNYARGHGNDTIIEAASGGTDDRLVLQGINPSAVSLVRNGNDVTLVIAESTPGAGDGGSVLLKDNFEEYYDQGIDKIVFGDGTIWTRAALRTAFLAQSSTSGNDVITGFAVNDTINAGDGNDQVFAGDGADTLTGGKGADSLYGGAGNDTYIYARGDGNDTIQEDSGGGAGDQLTLTGINPSDVTLVRDGANASLVIAESAPGAGDGGSILLKANFDEDNGQGVDKIVFADGTIWTRAELRAMYLAQVSTAGNDTITGFGSAETINAGAGNDVVDAGAGNDDLRGGTGNDTLSGGDGSDTYHYARGDGDDIIIEGPSGGGQDSLVLEGISRSDVTVVRNGNDVTIFIAESAPGAGDGGSVQLKNNADQYPNSGVDGVVFAGGTAWSKSDLFANIDFVGGTAGNDTITGTTGNDLVRAGKGNDTLLGGGGNDEYHYQRGDGNDTIVEDINGGTDDRLVLEGINPANVSLVRNGNDLTVMITESAPGAGDGGSVLVKETLEDTSNRGIEKIVFADGTTWTQADLRVMVLDRAGTSGNDTIVGFNGADTIQGRAGNDALSGGASDDLYLYARGDGNDTITEDTNNGSNDRLGFSNIDVGAVSLARNGNDVTVVIAESTPGAGDGGSVLLKNSLDDNYGQGVDKVVFADGTTWTRADIRVKLLDQAGTAGNDAIAGFNTADTIQGRAGNDALNGAGGDDTYLYARGDGNDTITEDTNNGGNDRLVFTDINPSAVSLVRNGNDVTVVIAESTPGAGDGGSVLLKNSLDDYYGQGVDKVVFANGTIWTRADIRAMLVSASGTSGDDTINGTGSSDIIAGHAGNDTLNGGGGDDTYLYARGDGNDTINEGTNGGGNDQLVFSDINPAAVSLVRNGNDVTVVIAESAPGAGDGGSVLLKDTLNDNYGQGVDKVVFADGTIWTRAQLRDMLLTGTAANETFAGFWGN
ncbi:calcium-binding protein, partial [Mesorhizobium sp. WSM4311]